MNNKESTTVLKMLDEKSISIDIILKGLAKNVTAIEAIKIIRSIYEITLGQAKIIVNSSGHWGTRTDEFAIYEALEEVVFCDKNSIKIINPYKYLDMWVFDDEKHGLVKEPFVGGADTMIDFFTRDIADAKNGFIMLFSDCQFPGHTIHLKWVSKDGGGNIYESFDPPMHCWLCPALEKYFENPPPELFVQVKPDFHLRETLNNSARILPA